jgi:ATP-dependent protease HslVU (ClpYQ) ATPase subunit
MRNLPIKEAARMMAKSEQFVRIGLQRNILPFGSAVKVSTKYTYYISPEKFYEYIGGTK